MSELEFTIVVGGLARHRLCRDLAAAREHRWSTLFEMEPMAYIVHPDQYADMVEAFTGQRPPPVLHAVPEPGTWDVDDWTEAARRAGMRTELL